MSASHTPVRWGIVGAGRIAHTFAQDMAHSVSGHLCAVAARNGDRAQAFCDQYGVGTAYAGYDALYADPDIDAIYIATPHTHHLQQASDALQAGKAVLCEKPITTNAAQCRALMDVAERTGGYLMEAMWTWFLPAVQQAKAWCDAGRIGRIVQVQSDFGYPLEYDATRREYDASLGGGCLLEMGVYSAAFAVLFAGASPDTVMASVHRAPNGVDDHVVAVLDYADCVATVSSSFQAKLRNWAYIVGERGYIAIPNFWRADECQLWVLDECVDRFADTRSSHGFEFQINAVNADLHNGASESAVVPLAASLRVQALMDRILGAGD